MEGGYDDDGDGGGDDADDDHGDDDDDDECDIPGTSFARHFYCFWRNYYYVIIVVVVVVVVVVLFEHSMHLTVKQTRFLSLLKTVHQFIYRHHPIRNSSQSSDWLFSNPPLSAASLTPRETSRAPP